MYGREGRMLESSVPEFEITFMKKLNENRLL